MRYAEHFPELTDFTDEALRVSGYTRRAISVFDHWLTEEELVKSNLLTYKDAAASGSKHVYLDQERRFLAFYRDLFAGGGIRKTQVRGRDVGYATYIDWDRKLKRSVVLSLRERRRIDAYIPSIKLRILGGFDRTDQLLFESDVAVGLVEGLAISHGLFVI